MDGAIRWSHEDFLDRKLVLSVNQVFWIDPRIAFFHVLIDITVYARAISNFFYFAKQHGSGAFHLLAIQASLQPVFKHIAEITPMIDATSQQFAIVIDLRGEPKLVTGRGVTIFPIQFFILFAIRNIQTSFLLYKVSIVYRRK